MSVILANSFPRSGYCLPERSTCLSHVKTHEHDVVMRRRNFTKDPITDFLYASGMAAKPRQHESHGASYHSGRAHRYTSQLLFAVYVGVPGYGNCAFSNQQHKQVSCIRRCCIKASLMSRVADPQSSAAAGLSRTTRPSPTVRPLSGR